MYPHTSIDLLPTAGPGLIKAEPAQLLPASITSTFYINRDRDEARRVFIEWYLREAGVDAERIPAVEGLAVPRSQVHFFYDDDTQSSRLNPGEVGCYASHLMAASIVIDRGLEHALILEDDAEFSPEFAQSLENILASLPAGWDLVHLSGDPSHATKPVARLEQSGTLVRYSRVPSGTVAYLISRTGAKKFLTSSKRFWPVDTDLRQPWRYGLQIYGVVPALVYHTRRFPSTIAKGAKGERSRLRRGLPKPSRHCWTGNPLHTPQAFYFNLRTLGPLWWARCWMKNAHRRIMRLMGLYMRERKTFRDTASAKAAYASRGHSPAPLIRRAQ
jgi:glycosyl transferase family 25